MDVSAIDTPGILWGDNEGRIFSRIESRINPNGLIEGYWYVKNYDTSGEEVGQQGILMQLDKSNNLTYQIHSPAAFRLALTMGGYSKNAFFRADGTLTSILKNTAYVSQYEDIELKQSNNGISTTRWPAAVSLTDKNNSPLVYVGGTVYTNGDTATSLYSYNYDTSGNQIGSNYINLFMKQDGTKSYGIADPAAFRSAIGITRTVGNCTPTSVMTGGSIALYKYGQVVVAIANNITTSTITSRTQIATISNSAYYPSHQSYGNFNGIADGYYLIIDTQGKIYVDKTVVGRWGWAVWITN